MRMPKKLKNMTLKEVPIYERLAAKFLEDFTARHPIRSMVMYFMFVEKCRKKAKKWEKHET